MGPELRIVYPPISDYYNRSQIDAMLSTISGGSGYTTLSGINGIVAYYDNGVWYVDGSTISGTGSGDVSYQMLITTSGDIVAQIPIDYITLQKLTTTSGDIISQIPSLSGYATQAWVTTVSGVITAQIPSTSSDIPFSTGFQADGANNTSTTIYTPVMTGDTAPSPFVASADSIYGAGNEAYKAFDQSTFYSAWLSSGSSLPHWIKIDLGQAVVINKFRLAVPIDYNLHTT